MWLIIGDDMLSSGTFHAVIQSSETLDVLGDSPKILFWHAFEGEAQD